MAAASERPRGAYPAEQRVEQMVQVQTVTGPVDSNELGRTLVHEHIRISWPGEELDRTYGWDRAETVARAVDKMAELIDAGFRTFVDPCPIELGRDPELYAEIAQKSGMQMICTTGFYTEHGGTGLPYYWRGRDPEEVAEH
jgi:phosphotriesterase-related protein